MAVQSTARRAEVPQEAASAAMAKTVPDAEPKVAAAKPVRRPRAVSGTRSAASESAASAGQTAASLTKERPAAAAGSTRPATAARPAAARPSQKDPEPHVSTEDSDPPQQVGRPSAQSGRPAAAPAGGAPRQATATAPIVQTRSAARHGPVRRLPDSPRVRRPHRPPHRPPNRAI